MTKNRSLNMNLVSSIAFSLFALLGLFASLQLLLTELKTLKDPTAIPVCDINPLIACSNSLDSAQAHLFGMPNSILGIAAFSALAAFGVLLISKVSLPKWIWWALSVGTLIGMAYVVFFLHASVTVFKALCPYCMLIWVAVIGIFVLTWTNTMLGGFFGTKLVDIGRTTSRYWWLIVIVFYLLILLVIVVALQSSIGYLFS